MSNWDKLTEKMKQIILSDIGKSVNNLTIKEWDRPIYEIETKPDTQVIYNPRSCFVEDTLRAVVVGDSYAFYGFNVDFENELTVYSSHGKVVFSIGHCSVCGFELSYCMCFRTCPNCDIEYPVNLENPLGMICPMCGVNEKGEYFDIF